MDFVVILAGGSGTRFWPKSRAALPKQFLAFGPGEPLLLETFGRTCRVAPPERTLVITAAQHVERTRRLLPELPRANVIGEPLARDTAAAVGLAAALVERRQPGASVLVCPADHRIAPTAGFVKAARAADRLLREAPERLVVFGIAPTSPATGYGYIERGAPLGRPEGLRAFAVRRFHEKPKLARARKYVASGRFSWNAGLFAFSAATMLGEIERQLPELARELVRLPKRRSAGTSSSEFERALRRGYRRLPKVSLDHGVMEKARAVAVVIPDYAWDDVGSFLALERALCADAGGNVALGRCLAIGSRRNVVDAGDGLVALLGVEDLVVVRTGDVTLVTTKARSDEIKQLVAKLGETGPLTRFA